MYQTLSLTGWDASSLYNPLSIDTELSWILTDKMFNRMTAIECFAPKLRQRTDRPLAKPRRKELLTADITQIYADKDSEISPQRRRVR